MAWAGVVAAVLLGSMMVAFGAEPPSIELRGNPYDLYLEGTRMSDEDAATLERRLKDQPRDAEARFRLASYLGRRKWQDDAARAEFAEHYIWFVQNAPAASLFKVGAFDMNDEFDPRFGEARELWLKQARDYADNPNVQFNAGSFLLHSEPQEARRLMQRALELDPKNPDRYDRLAHWHHLQIMDAPREDVPKLAKEQFRLLKRAQELSGEDMMSPRVTDMAEAAMHGQETAEAKRLALFIVENPGDGWNHGNRIHHGHRILGTIALSEGDLEAASRHLLESGKTPGSPQLNSFGPSMELAAALLEQGRKEDVLKYLSLCEQFWGHESLKRWREQIQRGEKPSFNKFE